MLGKLFRPKWQHQKSAVRARAVAEGNLSAAEYFEIARNDAAMEVREQAIQRISSIESLLVLADKSPELQAAVARHLFSLVIENTDQEDATLTRVLDVIDDDQQRRSLALQAQSPQVRLAAVRKIGDEDLLKQTALHDKAVDVRRVALEQVKTESTLSEIAKLSRGRDKTIAKFAEQRLSQIRDKQHRSERRQDLLREMTKLVGVASPIDELAWQRLLADWERLKHEAGVDEQRQFATSRVQIDARLAEQQRLAREDRSRKAAREDLLQRLQALADDVDTADPNEVSAAIKILQTGWSEATPLADAWAERRFQDEWQEKTTLLDSRLSVRRTVSQQENRLNAAIDHVSKQLEKGDLSLREIERMERNSADTIASTKDPHHFEKPIQRLRNLTERLRSQFEQEQKHKQSLQDQLKTHIKALEAALADKALKPANAAHKAATGTLKELGKNLPASLQKLERRLRHMEPELRELQSWRNWGTDHAREELVEEAKVLAAAEIDLSQRAKELNRLRDRWKSLGGSGRGVQKLWKEFDAACTAAYSPIKAEHTKEKQTREQNLTVREGICADLESLVKDTDWETPDWRSIDKHLQTARRKWRDTGGVPHKAWKAIKARFDRAIESLDEHLVKERRHNFLQRQALVRDAEALFEHEDTRTAVAEARKLRDAWQVSVTSKPGEERKLWQAFNKAMDAVFARDQAARNEFKAGLDEQRSLAEALCSRVEQLADSDASESRNKRGELVQAEDEFRNLGTLPKGSRQALERRFEQAVQRVQKGIAEAGRVQTALALQQLHDLHGICEKAEALAQTSAPTQEPITELESDWEAAAKPDKHKPLIEQLQHRFAIALDVLAGKKTIAELGDLDAHAATREKLCVDLEILRGVDSPEDAKSLRLARQIDLLENAMKGGEKDKDKTIRKLQLDYLAGGAIVSDKQQSLTERFTKVFP